MHQENGSSVNNSSEKELNQGTQKQSSHETGKVYIPYSKRNPQNCPDDRFCNLFDYLERVIGVDMENAMFHDGELDGRKTKFVVFPNGKVLMANDEVASLSDSYDSDGPKGIFFVMLSKAFFGTYQTVFPYFRNEFIS